MASLTERSPIAHQSLTTDATVEEGPGARRAARGVVAPTVPGIPHPRGAGCRSGVPEPTGACRSRAGAKRRAAVMPRAIAAPTGKGGYVTHTTPTNTPRFALGRVRYVP